MTTQTGKVVLEYIGMKLDFSDKKKINIKMDSFIQKLL